MWPFKRRPDPQDQRDVVTLISDLAARISDIEDSVEHMGRRFTRLQQQVTRWSREYDEDLDEDDSDEVLDTINTRRTAHG